MEIYKRPNGLDKKYKPMILKWLCNLVGYKDYPHSFKDQWINWSIWNGELTISFDDKRTEEHKRLLELIPGTFLGVPQYITLKIVNKTTFYLSLERIASISYPDITDSKLINKNKHPDGEGGSFYSYDWQVFLSDGSSVHYHNQVEIMDMKKGDYLYNCIIQTRFFTRFLDKRFYKIPKPVSNENI